MKRKGDSILHYCRLLFFSHLFYLFWSFGSINAYCYRLFDAFTSDLRIALAQTTCCALMVTWERAVDNRASNDLESRARTVVNVKTRSALRNSFEPVLFEDGLKNCEIQDSQRLHQHNPQPSTRFRQSASPAAQSDSTSLEETSNQQLGYIQGIIYETNSWERANTANEAPSSVAIVRGEPLQHCSPKQI